MRISGSDYRIGNCVMAGLASVIGAGIVCSITEIPIQGAALLFSLFSSVFLITGAGNTINDYFDADIGAARLDAKTRCAGSGLKSGVW